MGAALGGLLSPSAGLFQITRAKIGERVAHLAILTRVYHAVRDGVIASVLIVLIVLSPVGNLLWG